jgi:pimeloyl-ACP methyl ester carboxylesterase
LCALEAALITDQVRKLILYEPALPKLGVPLYAPGVVERLEALLVAGDREGVLAVVYREMVGMPEAEFEQLKESAAWPARLASAHTLPRETRAEASYVFDAERFKTLTTPTLLLGGADSPAFFKEITAQLYAALPNSRIALMAGQQHLAMYTAPEVLVGEVVGFLEEAGALLQ